MNNNEACAEYFRGNSAYRRCFSEFEKKWKTYGKVTGIITLKNTSEEERRAIGGILGKTFYENTIRFPFAEFEKGLQYTKFAPVDFEQVLEAYFGRKTLTTQERQKEAERGKADFFETVESYLTECKGPDSIAVSWLQDMFSQKKYGYQTVIREYGRDREKTEKLFAKVGVTNVGELLSYYPRTYETYGEIQKPDAVTDGMTAALYGQFQGPLAVKRVKNMQIVSGVFESDAQKIRITWYNMPYLRSTVRAGVPYVLWGKAAKKNRQLVLEQPAVFSFEEYHRMRQHLKPVYPLTEGLSAKTIEKAVRQALESLPFFKETLPPAIRSKYHLAEYHFTLEQIHFPENREQMLLARRRLVFDEFYLFILALRQLKQVNERNPQRFQIQKIPLTDQIIANLSFSLTGAQKKVWQEIERDMTGDYLMSRLIQGDVGSGKTILAFLALFLAAGNGWQGCLMVPTEVLAVQHMEAIQKQICEQKLPFYAELLTGSMTAKQKREACGRIVSGESRIIIGTHAVFQEKIQYKNLALVITDEQHRFGVRQRESLSEKGDMPHVMVMSATPIPRTLAVILYGDLDISVVNELPANRLPVKNCVVDTSYRPKAYRFIEKQVKMGHQAYIICPMVEESEQIEAEDVISYTEKLRSTLPQDITVSYLHGKMKPAKKNEIMEAFVKNEIQVLVSTTVIEVGVNVPNASVMMIENAERFGLAQLHQLRGRVGRGDAQSYCILCYGKDGEKTKKRLEILNKSNDGFYIANEDLRLRGPGDLFGIRQSGELAFRIGDVFQDAAILQEANDAANDTLQDPSYPEGKDYAILRQNLEKYMYKDLCNLNL